nr:alpha/beta hydrolase fold domain-containing protein [Halalkalicoccus paucihalophilus]
MRHSRSKISWSGPHGPVFRHLTRNIGCGVPAVGYRLAPEYPVLVPIEDAYAVTALMAAECSHARY